MKEMMTVKELSELLGIGINQTYSLVRKDDFPKIRINKQYIIPRDRLVQWIDKNICKTIKV
jgi:excisionase family DNA binding protein